MKSLLKRFKLL